MKPTYSLALLLVTTPFATGNDFFESKIRPVLVKHCYECHSAEAGKSKGGLLLDTREGIRTGGDTGPAVVPGDLEKSLLIAAIRWHDPDTGMPPEKKGGKLPDSTIADIAVYGDVAYAEEGAIDLAPYANVKAWMARIEKLPGFKKYEDVLPKQDAA